MGVRMSCKGDRHVGFVGVLTNITKKICRRRSPSVHARRKSPTLPSHGKRTNIMKTMNFIIISPVK